MNTQYRHSRTGRQSWLIVAALAAALALSPAMARPQTRIAPDPGAERFVAQAFAHLDAVVASRGCLPSSLIQKLDLVFIGLHDWDARSRLHSAEYPVCRTLSAGQ